MNTFLHAQKVQKTNTHSASSHCYQLSGAASDLYLGDKNLISYKLYILNYFMFFQGSAQIKQNGKAVVT